MTIITSERAAEIRGELTEKYGATWLHHYHEAIEAEVLVRAPRYVEIGTSVTDLLQSCKEGWRHADELEQERQRLTAVNAELLDALNRALDLGVDEDGVAWFHWRDAAVAAIAKATGGAA